MKKQNYFGRIFNSSEEIVSMFLGLVIVVAVIGLVFNYFQKKRGSVDLAGISDQKNLVLGEKLNNDNKPTEKQTTNYEVKKGDNLWKIAQAKYGSGYKWVDIAKANKLNAPGLLTAGQKLVMPSLEQSKEVLTSVATEQNKIEAGTYKVVRSDNLWKIAVRAYGDGYQWVQIWTANKSKLVHPDRLEIGMLLEIPGKK